MREVDRYLDEVCGDLSGSQALRRHLREELREHLEDAMAAHRAAGLNAEEATRQAIEEFGESRQVRSEFQGVYGRRLMALLIERAMDWKARTMRSDWKWNFVAHVALLLTMAVLVFWTCSVAVFITPVAVDMHDRLGMELAPFVVKMIQAAGFIKWTAVYWVPLIGVAVVLFEWRCRRENKGTIRLGLGTILVLLLSVAAVIETGSIGVAMIRATRQAQAQQSEQPAAGQALQADAVASVPGKA